MEHHGFPFFRGLNFQLVGGIGLALTRGIFLFFYNLPKKNKIMLVLDMFDLYATLEC
jgi:hypothetical protein